MMEETEGNMGGEGGLKIQYLLGEIEVLMDWNIFLQ